MSRSWPEETRAEALRVYSEHGMHAASRATGVPRPTIYSWARAADVYIPASEQVLRGVEMIRWNEANQTALRAHVRGALLAAAADTLERMDQPYQDFVGKDGDEVEYERPPANALRDMGVTVGILIDKYRLEVGEPGTITQQIEGVTTLDDHEKATLARLLRDAISEKAADAAVGG